MRRSDTTGATRETGSDARGGTDTEDPAATTTVGSAVDRNSTRCPRATSPGRALPLAVAGAVVVAVVARAVAAGAGSVVAAAAPSTLAALGVATPLRSVAESALLVAWASGLVAVLGAGYCVARAGLWLSLGRGSGAGRGEGAGECADEARAGGGVDGRSSRRRR